MAFDARSRADEDTCAFRELEAKTKAHISKNGYGEEDRRRGMLWRGDHPRGLLEIAPSSPVAKRRSEGEKRAWRRVKHGKKMGMAMV